MNLKEYQEQFFKITHKIYPALGYNQIVANLLENYNIKTISYTNNMFTNFKKNYSTKNNNKYDAIKKIESIEINGIKLMQMKLNYNSESYTLDNKDKKKIENNRIIRIFATKESLSLLSNKNSSQFFIDGTYKCIPYFLSDIKVFILLICYNEENDLFELCLIATFSHEDTDCYKTFYSYLKFMYNFKPNFMTCDFAKANITALNSVFENDKCEIITCLFHLVQSWWRKATKLGLRKKKFINTTKIIIFNLKMLPFMERNDAIEFYKKIKEIPNNYEDFSDFFEYFETTYLSLDDKIKEKYDFDLWNYTKKINLKGNKDILFNEKIFKGKLYLSNNCCESLNHLINNIIDINSNVSITKFIEIIKFLFLRFNINREKKNQKKEQISITHNLSDTLLLLNKYGIGKKKILNFKDIKFIKNINSEEEIFKFIFDNDCESEKEDQKEKSIK